MCKEAGISLVEVPYWWDRTADSLAATIYSHRPDLFAEKPQGTPIPANPPAVSNKDECIIFFLVLFNCFQSGSHKKIVYDCN